MIDFLSDELKRAQKTLMLDEEKILLEQLQDLLKRGLLVVYKQQPILTSEGDTLKISQGIYLTLQNIEYVKNLEAENIKLKANLSRIQEVFDGEL